MAIHFDSLRTGLGQAVAAYGIQPVSGKIKRLDPTGDGSKRAGFGHPAIVTQWQECANRGHCPTVWRAGQIDTFVVIRHRRAI